MSLSEPTDHQRMAEIAEGLPSKSEKIRKLSEAGFQKADIARFLGIRYQFVYNVLAAAERSNGEEPISGASEMPRSNWHWTKVDKGGRVALPDAFLEALEINEGDDVQLRLASGRVEILTRDGALRSLQEDVRRYVPEGRSLVDELIAERRAEAAREEMDG